MKNWAFYKSLHKRGMTLKALAPLVGLKRHGHLCEVLNNKPGHGGRTTRVALFEVLTVEEIKHLGWYWQYRAWLRKNPRSTGNNVPISTTLQPIQEAA